MKINRRIDSFLQLKTLIYSLSKEEKSALFQQAKSENNWFTDGSISMALDGIVHMLEAEKLNKWLVDYRLSENSNKTLVGLVLAGNIPMVGFHDLLCVLLAGHKAKLKLSSQDSVLMKFICESLINIDEGWENFIEYADRLNDIDAVIATGSDNSARYFEHYFGKYPNIIRKNRTSVAVLNGHESSEELTKLGVDVFSYFGLGCRNVSKVWLPANYDIKTLTNAWEVYKEIADHSKYANNYDYNKAILLMEKIPFEDTGYVLMTESEDLVSPTSVIYFQHYEDEESLSELLKKQQEKIQVVIGNIGISITPFGKAQFPELWDYADNIDTMKFLTELNRAC